MNPDNLNLYIVDDEEAVRRSVGSLLLARLSDCSIKTFESGEAFLRGARLDSSGIVILDLRMEPGMSGLDVHKALQDQRSPLVVVFLSSHGDIPVAVRAMQDGAISWLPKPCTDEQLLQTIETARARAKEIAIGRRDRHAALQKWSRLTLREMQSCALVAPGKSAKEVAQMLSKSFPDREIDPRTVEHHRAKAFLKLEVKNSNELLLFLLQNDLWDLAQDSLATHPGRLPEET